MVCDISVLNSTDSEVIIVLKLKLKLNCNCLQKALFKKVPEYQCHPGNSS